METSDAGESASFLDLERAHPRPILPEFPTIRRAGPWRAVVLDDRATGRPASSFSTARLYSHRVGAPWLAEHDFPSVWKSLREALRGAVIAIIVAEQPGGPRGLHVGDASWDGASFSNGVVEVAFKLAREMPLDVWDRVGGYRGWLLDPDGSPTILAAERDEVEAFVERLRAGDVRIRATNRAGDFVTFLAERDVAYLSFNASFLDDGGGAESILAPDRPPPGIDGGGHVFHEETHPGESEFRREWLVRRDEGLAGLVEVLLGRRPAGMRPVVWGPDGPRLGETPAD